MAISSKWLLIWGTGAAALGARLEFATLQWHALPIAPIEPRTRPACGLIGEKFVVWGGYGNPGGTPGPIEGDGAIYDCEKDSWRRISKAPIRFAVDTVWVVSGQRFLVFSREPREAKRRGAWLDVQLNEWRELPDVPEGIGMLAACAATDSQVLLWSGQQGERRFSDAGAVYDFRTESWTKLPHAPIAGRALARTAIVDDRVFIWGGWIEGKDGKPEPLRDGAVYDLSKQSWSRMASFPSNIPGSLYQGWHHSN